ncbi:hypothetical protein TrispH2_008763 [Trichoplax sp. H2]|nr:hypothetical protein TrispH2_008763 [Trichoplax sp. H2]|eukprot:RDD39485.1 hypothetical protein TrispH2_008763 [Trichoplax sp. H2]
MARYTCHQFYILFQLCLVLILIQWTIHHVNYASDRLYQRRNGAFKLHSLQQSVQVEKANHRIRKLSNNSRQSVNLITIESARRSNRDIFPVKSYFIPMVIFSSFRLHYITQLLQSLKVAAMTANLDGASPCLFVLHRNKDVSQQHIRDMQRLLNTIQFCKVYQWRVHAPNQGKRTASSFKAVWFDAVKRAFESQKFATSTSSYEDDIIFLEDDIILSPDALKVFRYGIYQKNRHNSVIAVALGGWSGENVINAHPDTFIVRRSFHFPSMAYAFNVSTWKIIKSSKFLKHRNRDWSEALGDIVNRRLGWVPYFIVPTLGRIWHIGSQGLGLRGDSSMRRHVELRAHWTKAPRLINFHSAKVNKGYRDLFGFYCGQFILKSSLCPRSYIRFPPGRRFDIICIDAGNGPEPCLRKYPYLERDFTNWIH